VKREGALWFPSYSDFLSVESRTNLDHVARPRFLTWDPRSRLEERAVKDLFGVEWVFVEKGRRIHGKARQSLLEDANDWPKVNKVP
jgi:hypothetical protein